VVGGLFSPPHPRGKFGDQCLDIAVDEVGVSDPAGFDQFVLELLAPRGIVEAGNCRSDLARHGDNFAKCIR